MRYNFECPFCNRPFNRRDNFKHHILSQHDSSDRGSVRQNSQNVFTEQEKCSDFSSSKPQEPFIFDINAKSNKFVSILQQAVLQIVAKLSMEIGIPRNFIQKVIVLIKDFLNSGFLHIYITGVFKRCYYLYF